MLMPTVFHENLFDDFFDPFWNDAALERMMNREARDTFGKRGANMMKTDVKETEHGYEVAIDLPGFKKDEVKAELKDGYLTISAARGLDKDEQDKNGTYIRRERYAGNMSRSFYVGEDITETDIHAQFENGILMLDIPKKEEKKPVDEKRYVTIEG